MLYSSSEYEDELVWAAAWLYKATGEEAYLNRAEQLYTGMFGPESPLPRAEYGPPNCKGLFNKNL